MSSRSAVEPRIRLDVLLDAADRRSALHDATFWGLRSRPKELPTVWLYDERGSLLFDEITRLPEYYLTRREREILVARAAEVAVRTETRTLVELGSGTADKTQLLLDALAEAGTLERYVPLDVSEGALRASSEEIAARYPSIGVHAIVGDFERHLDALPAGRNRLVAFLGSTIGNLDPVRRGRLLAAVASVLAPGDAFLLGVDLVKDPARLNAAYADPRGVTETFVRNALTVVNRELRASFDQENFDFEARWDAGPAWLDIGFRARRKHVVAVPELEIEVPFAADEPLRVEISAKFERAGLESELARAGLRIDEWWTDRAGDFALLLAAADEGRPHAGDPPGQAGRSVTKVE